MRSFAPGRFASQMSPLVLKAPSSAPSSPTISTWQLRDMHYNHNFTQETVNVHYGLNLTLESPTDPITSYDVQYWNIHSAAWSSVNTTGSGAVTNSNTSVSWPNIHVGNFTYTTDETVANGGLFSYYRFRVRATNANGSSSWVEANATMEFCRPQQTGAGSPDDNINYADGNVTITWTDGYNGTVALFNGEIGGGGGENVTYPQPEQYNYTYTTGQNLASMNLTETLFFAAKNVNGYGGVTVGFPASCNDGYPSGTREMSAPAQVALDSVTDNGNGTYAIVFTAAARTATYEAYVNDISVGGILAGGGDVPATSGDTIRVDSVSAFGTTAGANSTAP